MCRGSPKQFSAGYPCREAVPGSQVAVPGSQVAVRDLQAAVPGSQADGPGPQPAVPGSQPAAPLRDSGMYRYRDTSSLTAKSPNREDT